MRCSMCGHENPPGASFCLNCGTAVNGNMQTPAPAPGLPTTCAACATPNPPGMKFCRNCGGALQPPPPPPLFGGYPAGPPSSMPSGLPGPPPSIPPSMMPGTPGMAGGRPPEPVGMAATMAASLPDSSAGGAVGTSPGGSVKCPRCSAPTPGHLAYCQQCGLHLQVVASTDPGGAVRPGKVGPIDPQGATLAAPGAGLPLPPLARPDGGHSTWGTLVLVNRDGSDGERFPLSGELAEIGRGGADIAFAQDRFLARSHARLERTGDGARVNCLDTLNGVFRRLELPAALEDGDVLLVGREVLRFERVDANEAAAEPLVRHGVALFGSPPRAPWGRLSELLPSGGVRDVRHLNGPEFVIGREEGDFVVRDDAFMSRRHAAINWDGQRARITDLGSSNGTFMRLSGSVPLRHGDHLRMGDQLFRVELG